MASLAANGRRALMPSPCWRYTLCLRQRRWYELVWKRAGLSAVVCGRGWGLQLRGGARNARTTASGAVASISDPLGCDAPGTSVRATAHSERTTTDQRTKADFTVPIGFSAHSPSGRRYTRRARATLNDARQRNTTALSGKHGNVLTCLDPFSQR